MSGNLEKYLMKIREATSKPGVYAYRGQANSRWRLHSAATRRLIKDHGSDEILLSADFSNVYREYHRKTLVESARARGFDVERGRKVSDLQLLAKLQHFRAATGLLDFTWNPLVALWFAVEDTRCDGKLFIVKTDDTLNVALVSSDEQKQGVDTIFSPADNSPRLSYWEPTLSGDAMLRILRQRSLFIIGHPLIPEDAEIIKAIEIAKEDKALLLDDLELLDVSQRSLFQDIYGFSEAESASSPLRQIHNPDYYFLRGNQFYQRGEYLKAIEDYGECIDLAPDGVEPYLLRGNAKDALGRHKDAIADFNEAIRLKPDFAAAYNNRGIAKDALGRYKDAIADFNEAIRLKPDLAEAYSNRGQAKLALEQYKEAIADLNEAIRLKPDLAGVYYNRGAAKAAWGQYKEATADYDQALRLKPDFAEAYNNRGIAKGGLKRYKEAITDFNEAIRLKPDLAEAYSNRGQAKRALKQYKEATADFDEAIRLKPDDAAAYNNRGNAKGALKRYKEAITDFNEAIRLKPDDAAAYNNRGNAKGALKQYKGAIADFNEAIRLKPDDAAAYGNRRPSEARVWSSTREPSPILTRRFA